MIIESILGINAGVFERVDDALIPTNKFSSYSERKQTFYNKVSCKYSSLVYSCYDDINQYNDILSAFADKYDFTIITNLAKSEKITLRIYVNNLILSETLFSYELNHALPLIDKKIESYVECCNNIIKDISICEELKKELKLAFPNTSQNIHDVTYSFDINYYYQFGLEYSIEITQKYHEKEVTLYELSARCEYSHEKYINRINMDIIETIINTIKDTNGKPYEYEITIEDLPTGQYLFDNSHSAIKRIISTDGYDRDGNFYRLTEKIDNYLFISITDSYTITSDNHNCGEGRVGIVMSVYTFKKDYDIHAYLMNLKKLYYQYIKKYQCSLHIATQEDFYAAFDNASIVDLGPTKKELVKLY